MGADPVPRWSSLSRSGAPPCDGLWPFDPELAQLELTRRRVIKRETRSKEEARVAIEWLSAHGLAVASQGSVVVAATDVSSVSHACELDAAGDRDSAAVSELGALLGYPRCCVERYLALELRDDAALFSALLPADAAPAPAESLWLVGALALVSHAPCSLRCVGTLELGRATLGALDAKHSGFASRWRGLAARLHQIDARGRVLATSTDVLEVVPDPVPRAVPPGVFEASPARWRADHRGQ